jgi:CRP-like cAMP-binding protein
MELEKELDKLEGQMFNLCDMFPGIVKSLQTKQAAKIILNDQINFLEECFDEGVITENEFERLRTKIDCQLKYLSLKDFDHQIKGFSDLQFVSPIFRHVQNWDTNEDLKELLTSGEKQKFKKGDLIISADKPVFGVYILTKGRVEEIIVNHDKEYQNNLGFGHVISFANILGENHRSRSTIRAGSNETELVFLEVGRLKLLLSKNPKFEEEIFKEALVNLLKTEKTFSDFVFDDDVILNVLSEAKVKHFHQNVNHSFTQIAFLVKGQIQNCDNGNNFLAPMLIPTNQVFKFVSPNSSVILIPQVMDVYVNEHFRFSSDKAVNTLGKMSLGRISGLMQNSFVRNVNQAKKDGEFVEKIFLEASKKLDELKEVQIK